MNRFVMIVYSTFIFLVLLISTSQAQDLDEIRDAYQTAKMKSMDRKFTEAIALFDEFLEKYPGTKYEDGALFWTAYSQEQLPGQRKKAFNTYSTLVKNFPNSTWIDDALGHQIILAEQFVLSGEESYKEFLYVQLRKEQKEYQFRTAIALGKIGDKKALPVLEKMKNDEDYGDMAMELIDALSTEKIPVDDEARKITDKKKMDLVYEKDQEKSDKEEPEDRTIFDTERHKQYSSMLRKDDDWSKDELVNFAFWHILDTDEFKAYSSLSSDYDKEEWRRKFWKRKDPTPTTKENEIEIEFLRRITYSRSHFADFWNYLSFKYMPDQHLRLGWPHAPWDARGELYIKYGEPDYRSQQGYHQEIWTYSRYSVDFLVKQYMTNIYGNAITAGEMSYRSYGSRGGRIDNFDHLNPLSSSRRLNETLWNSVNMYVQTNFIFNQEFRYVHNYDAEPIEGLQLLFDKDLSQEKRRVIFRYQLPVDEFELVSQPGGLEVRYKEVYCVLDEDLREVAKNEIIRRIGNIPNDDFKFEESILLNLTEGTYTLHLRIEDQNANNLGIFSHQFEVTNL
jgi:hypothetical protein